MPYQTGAKTQGVRQWEGKTVGNIMDEYEPYDKRFCLVREVIKAHKQRCYRKHKNIPCKGSDKSNSGEFFEIVLSFRDVSCTHTLSDNRDKYRTHCHTHQRGHAPDALSNTVCSYWVCAEQCNHAAERNLDKLRKQNMNEIVLSGGCRETAILKYILS